MKITIRSLFASLLLAFPVLAQVEGPPALIDYQGRVLDENSNPVAQNGVQNIEMYFRIWNHISERARENLVWAEKQIVTVANGDFSVRLGEGDQIQASANDTVVSPGKDDPRGSLLDVFDGNARFLGVSVAPDSVTKPTAEIQPRLAFLASPFAIVAEHAKLADAVKGVVMAAPGSTFNGTVTAGSVLRGDGAGLTSLNASNLSAGDLADARLTNNVALLNRNQQHFTGAVNTFSERVGIGTSSPSDAYKLDISGGNLWLRGLGGEQWIDIDARVNNSTGDPLTRIKASNDGAHGGHLDLLTKERGAPTNSLETRMRITSRGNVGIGTTNPTQAKLVVDGLVSNVRFSDYSTLIQAGVRQHSSGFWNTSIWASNAVVAKAFVALSDRRIKESRGVSNRSKDLADLLRLEVTDFTYKDKIEKGSQVHKKLIAQQVEQIYPTAVHQSTGVVPDIYQLAGFKDGWVIIESDVKVGERVRFITENGQGVHEVLEIGDGAFRTDLKTGEEEVFVYGREVDDFRSVDYEAIAMLNVSATQEIHRRLQKQEDENESLRKRLAVLEARDTEREARVTKLERLFGSLPKGSLTSAPATGRSH